LVGEGLNVGKDPGEAATADYSGERAVRDHRGHRQEVIVDVSGAPFIDLEREVAVMFACE
jgi:hypothetical protein